MRFTIEQYDKAIKALEAAKTQLDPDGDECRCCGDSGHQAWECGHNPLLAMAICEGIAKASEELHAHLHYLAGHVTVMGHRTGPASVIVPAADE